MDTSLSLFHRINAQKLELFLDLPMPQIVAFFQNARLIRYSYDCPHCNLACVAKPVANPIWPGYKWKCPGCSNNYSALIGSWFHRNMRLDIRSILRMIYSFCWETASFKRMQHELRRPNGKTINSHTFVDYFSFFREICDVDVKRSPQIGGPGKVFEIDESAVCKRKYNRGKRIAPQQWLFGGVERGAPANCFVVPVPRRDSVTLLALIAHFIAPGTTIISDCWKAYHKIGKMGLGFQHFTVNHSITFKCPKTGACTNTIEGLWQKIKLPMKVRYGTHRSQLPSHVATAVFFRKHAHEDRFEAFFEAVRKTYPLP